VAEVVIKHEAKPSAILPSRLSTEHFVFVQHKQGDALNDLWNFIVVACNHTLKLVINKRNTNHYSHIKTKQSNSCLFYHILSLKTVILN